jgi:hypothetical protein
LTVAAHDKDYSQMSRGWIIVTLAAASWLGPATLPSYGAGAEDILQSLGSRSDRNFMGRPGNLSAIAGEKGGRLIYMGLENLPVKTSLQTAKVIEWRPDYIRLETGALVQPDGSPAMVHGERFCWVGDKDTLVTQWVIRNTGQQPAQVQIPVSVKGATNATLSGASLAFELPGIYPSLFQGFHAVLQASQEPRAASPGNAGETLQFEVSVPPSKQRTLTVALAFGPDAAACAKAASVECAPDSRQRSTEYWKRMLADAVPSFSCSDPYLERLYYFRWYSLLTKMNVGGYGRWKEPAAREGVVGFNSVISYSGGPNTLELRWLRSPEFAYGNLRTFFNNLHEGKLANHIYPDSVDHDVANVAPGPDGKPMDVPYHNFLITALLETHAVHPDRAALADLWPKARQSARLYDALLDADTNGLYEAYPWSNITGQEFGARFEYFHPYDQLLDYARTWSPRDDAEAARAADQIESAVTLAPDIRIPRTAEEMRTQVEADRHYRQETVDENCYAVREFASLAKIARILGDRTAAAEWGAKSDRTRRLLLERMWDAETDFFYDLDQPTKRKAMVKSPTGFFPFWAGIATKRNLPALGHLFDPDEFWTAYPLPSIQMNDPKLNGRKKLRWTYWNWNNWPMATSHVVDGLARAAKDLDPSLTPRAAELLKRYIRVHFINSDLNRPCLPENFDPVTGKPNWPALDYAHSYCIDIIMRHVCGIEPDPVGDQVVIRPLDLQNATVSWFEVRAVRVKGHDLGVRWRNRVLTVTVDGMVAKTQRGLKPIRLRIPPK